MPFSQSVEVTHTATFTIMVTGCISKNVIYQWRHNGTVISGMTGDTLKIINVIKSDSGNYTCIVRNKFGDTILATSNVAVLSVTSELANYVNITITNNNFRYTTCYHSTPNGHNN